MDIEEGSIGSNSELEDSVDLAELQEERVSRGIRNNLIVAGIFMLMTRGLNGILGVFAPCFMACKKFLCRCCKKGRDGEDDWKSSKGRFQAAQDQRTMLETELEQLKLEIEQKQKSLKGIVDEEKMYKSRVGLRQEQMKQLKDRLDNGWADERQIKK